MDKRAKGDLVDFLGTLLEVLDEFLGLLLLVLEEQLLLDGEVDELDAAVVVVGFGLDAVDDARDLRLEALGRRFHVGLKEGERLVYSMRLRRQHPLLVLDHVRVGRDRLELMLEVLLPLVLHLLVVLHAFLAHQRTWPYHVQRDQLVQRLRVREVAQVQQDVVLQDPLREVLRQSSGIYHHNNIAILEFCD